MRSLNIKASIMLLSFVFFMSLVMAVQQGQGYGVDISSSEIDAVVQENGQGLEVNTSLTTQNQGETTSLGNQVQIGVSINQSGEQVQIQIGEGKELKIKSGDIEVSTMMNMTQEQGQNMSRLKVKLSNGFNVEIKVMPNTASETALARLGAKCEERNCTIELKEVGTGNQTRAVYEVKTQKQAKVLGLFSAKMPVQAQVDAENGEVIQAKKPWWAFLATETA